MPTRRLLEAALDLVLMGECALCAAHLQGRAALCAPCAVEVDSQTFPAAQRTQPDPAPSGFPACATAASGDAVRGLVTAWKDHGRTDLQPILTALLAQALSGVVDEADLTRARWRDGAILLVPAPISALARRRQGQAPMLDLARTVLTEDFALVDALVLTRVVADQSRLGWRERARNVGGSMGVRTAAVERICGADCVVVDDIVTTGATLTEASRALLEAGARTVQAATCIASVRKRLPESVRPTSVRP